MIRSLLLFSLASMMAPPAFADDVQVGNPLAINATTIFVPIGFDDNDEAEIVVDGYMPSGCYRLMAPDIQVNLEDKRIVIRPMGRFFDVPCIATSVPYFFAAKLGQLPKGDYSIEVIGSSNTLSETLPVKQAFSPGPDDYSYAPVDDIKVELDRVSHKMVATLRGRFTSSCMKWGKAMVQDNGKTINLLPVIAIDKNEACAEGEATYEQQVNLPDSITRGRHLLHVRTLNGQAINALFFKLQPPSFTKDK